MILMFVDLVSTSIRNSCLALFFFFFFFFFLFEREGRGERGKALSSFPSYSRLTFLKYTANHPQMLRRVLEASRQAVQDATTCSVEGSPTATKDPHHPQVGPRTRISQKVTSRRHWCTPCCIIFVFLCVGVR